MKKIAICGHFGFGKNLLNGQTVKTKIISDELDEKFNSDSVLKIDTSCGLKGIIHIIINSIKAFKNCEDIIILPAHNGLRLIVPMYTFFNKFAKRKIHYVVIGGWLDVYLDKHTIIQKQLKKFSYIYVETKQMKKDLEKKEFNNLVIMPNCKKLSIIEQDKMTYYESEPYRICTFSRVLKEKGIEDAISVVTSINSKYKRTIFELDIYGSIDKKYELEFEKLRKNFPQYIKYCGEINQDESVDIIKQYFLLLFPTRFYTEGIPGTIIDAYSSGVPVIASRWMNFSDIIDDNKTGFGYKFGDNEDLQNLLLEIINNPQSINQLKVNCINKAKEYNSKNVILKCMKI